LGVTNVQMPLPAIINPQSVPLCDRILIDAPCSNTGVMRRRVDLRWRIQATEIERLRATQLELLRQAASKLKAGGVLVYSTCSLEPEENSGVVKSFLAAHSDFELETERQLLPFVDGVDGAFVARLLRK
ncbi:MAG: 16S rRNA (cytosine(967)-C(5))-methyltransferase RsmB, partial [Verrucomicrobiota bacterium]